MQSKSRGISIEQIMNRLKLSRNYITRNITHCITHVEYAPSKGTKVFFEERELRDYLKNQATFTRQTKLINLRAEIEEYKKKFPEKSFSDSDFLGKVPKMFEFLRGHIPTVTVDSFDFWDLPLIFPQYYFKGEESAFLPRKNAEICYRDMFKLGATKIQLGKQKTMFCIRSNEIGVNLPEVRDLLNYESYISGYKLVPADWKPFYEGLVENKPEKAKAKPFEIIVKGNSENITWQEIEAAFRKVLILDRITDYRNFDDEFRIKLEARILNDKK